MLGVLPRRAGAARPGRRRRATAGAAPRPGCRRSAGRGRRATPASANALRAARSCSGSPSRAVRTPSGRMPRSSQSPASPPPLPIETTDRASTPAARTARVAPTAGSTGGEPGQVSGALARRDHLGRLDGEAVGVGGAARRGACPRRPVGAHRPTSGAGRLDGLGGCDIVVEGSWRLPVRTHRNDVVFVGGTLYCVSRVTVDALPTDGESAWRSSASARARLSRPGHPGSVGRGPGRRSRRRPAAGRAVRRRDGHAVREPREQGVRRHLRRPVGDPRQGRLVVRLRHDRSAAGGRDDPAPPADVALDGPGQLGVRG